MQNSSIMLNKMIQLERESDGFVKSAMFGQNIPDLSYRALLIVNI